MVISATDIKIENFKGHKMESNVHNRKIAIDSQELRDKNEKEILHRSRKITENNEAIIKSDMEKKCCKQDDTINGNMNKNIIQIREKSRVSVVDLFRKARFQRKLGRQGTIADSSCESEDEEQYGSDDDIDTEIYVKKKSKNSKSVIELIEPIATEFSLDQEMKRLEYLTSFIGCGSRRIPLSLRIFGLVTWAFNLSCHFMFDVYEGLSVYKYTFIVSQGMFFFAFITLTWGMNSHTVPCLQNGLRDLRRLETFEKSIRKIVKFQKKLPFAAISFGLIASGVQHCFLHIDSATNVDFKQDVPRSVYYILQVVRFLSGMHMFMGYLLFWMVPTIAILLAGNVMGEFQDQTGAKLQDRENMFTFKEAISSYTARVKFVRETSAKTTVVLSTLLATGIINFGLNAYAFLFIKRLYLHVLHSLLPLAVMIYPLCIGAWATKQYKSFIIVVVKAWIHRDDLDESSSDDSGIDDLYRNNGKKTLETKFSGSGNFKGLAFFKRKNNLQSGKEKLVPSKKKLEVSHSTPVDPSKKSTKEKQAPNELNIPLWQKAVLKTSDDEEIRPPSPSKLNTATVAAIGKFKKVAAKPRFNFEKFLAYLESMRGVVGFEIAGAIVTWDKVSTTLFFLFSIVAVFLQESIFGSQKSTLT